MSGAAALLLLADGRFPAGGHAHSGGAEAAVKAGPYPDAAGLSGSARPAAHGGAGAAALAAAAAAGHDPLALDEAADARTPSPALRRTARKLGRQMMRAARAAWPAAELDALAAARPQRRAPARRARASPRARRGSDPLDAAYAAAYESVSGPATAAVRLLSLDPFDATAVLARLAPATDDVARPRPPKPRDGRHRRDCPPPPRRCSTSPPRQHAAWAVRLFAS